MYTVHKRHKWKLNPTAFQCHEYHQQQYQLQSNSLKKISRPELTWRIKETTSKRRIPSPYHCCTQNSISFEWVYYRIFQLLCILEIHLNVMIITFWKDVEDLTHTHTKACRENVHVWNSYYLFHPFRQTTIWFYGNKVQQKNANVSVMDWSIQYNKNEEKKYIFVNATKC